jgi:hypothetical protein
VRASSRRDPFSPAVRASHAKQAYGYTAGDELFSLEDIKRGLCSVYSERNHLVAALSKLFPASVEQHVGPESIDPEWANVVMIDLPTGQVSWHIPEREIYLFAHLQRDVRTWDGHNTEEKYLRLAALASR